MCLVCGSVHTILGQSRLCEAGFTVTYSVYATYSCSVELEMT